MSPAALREALTDDTALVSVMHANNEIGTIQPIAELAALAHERGALLHTDAVQSVGKIPVDVRALGVDLLSLSAHKFNGPKGAGALWIKRGTRLQPHPHRRQARAQPARRYRERPRHRRARASQRGWRPRSSAPRRHGVGPAESSRGGHSHAVPGTVVNGAREPRVPNTTNISFDPVEAESLLIALDLEGVAVSTGSACSSGTLEPSHVLSAMGLPSPRTQNSIRFSLGAGNTDAEVDFVVSRLPSIVGEAPQPDAAPGAPRA